MNEKKTKKVAEARKRYDDENMSVLATKLRKEEAAAFRTYAMKSGKPVSRLLSDYIKGTLAQSEPLYAEVDGQRATLTIKNVNRLKREAAFHNPGGLNPDQIMNRILDRYFDLAAEIRGN